VTNETPNLFANLAAQAAVDNIVAQLSELDMLKQRAKLMGITFSNNIGVEGLKTKIAQKLAEESAAEGNAEPEGTEGDEGETQSESTQDANDAMDSAAPVPAFIAPAPAVAPTVIAAPPAAPVPQKKLSMREQLYAEQMRLVRVRITNLDPKKKDLPGEIFTVANEYIGAVKKYVPYGEVSDNGWHIPYCIYQALLERQFVDIRTSKGKNGVPVVTTRMAREFSLEVLEPLTEEELKQLATAQMAQGIGQ
jgi:hypothetical protein